MYLQVVLFVTFGGDGAEYVTIDGCEGKARNDGGAPSQPGHATTDPLPNNP